jgi:hypothetical protein
MRNDMARVRRRAAEMESRMTQELEKLRSSLGGELVPYGAYESKIAPSVRSTRIPVKRPQRNEG